MLISATLPDWALCPYRSFYRVTKPLGLSAPLGTSTNRMKHSPMFCHLHEKRRIAETLIPAILPIGPMAVLFMG